VRIKKVKIIKTYTLNDGRIITMKQLVDLTGVSKKTLWRRLNIEKTRDFNRLNVKKKPKAKPLTAFEKTYEDLSPELFKLLFGKW
jgi:predicted DNA-binding transcriptional regulator AlpA